MFDSRDGHPGDATRLEPGDLWLSIEPKERDDMPEATKLPLLGLGCGNEDEGPKLGEPMLGAGGNVLLRLGGGEFA